MLLCSKELYRHSCSLATVVSHRTLTQIHQSRSLAMATSILLQPCGVNALRCKARIRLSILEGRGGTSGANEIALHKSCAAALSDVNLHMGKSISQAVWARP